MLHQLLVIDEESTLSEHLTQSAHNDFICHRTPWAPFEPESLQNCPASLIVCVAASQPEKARQLFRWLRHNPLATPILAVLPETPDSQLLEAAAETANDLLFLPLRGHEWRFRILRLLGRENTQLTTLVNRLATENGLSNLVGSSPAFRRALERIPLLARAKTSVLITGETGTGKELCARAIHHLGPRRECPFIPADCAAFPDHLFENELFGHARGAFTDAHRDQKGMIAMAERGTIFLDEIDALSLAAQAKLLRFLQEKTYKPLGADRFHHADVRVLAATNRNVDALVRGGAFRSDLYFRVNVLQLHLAPLRERREDIAILARHFADSCCAENGLAHKTFSGLTLRHLEARDWPGNVRQLCNVIHRAVLLSEGTTILPRHLCADGTEVAAATAEEPGESGFRAARTRAVESFERVYVEQVLRKCDGNVTRAAREAKKDRRVFGRLVKKYKISRTHMTK